MVLERVIFLEDCFEQEVKEVKFRHLISFSTHVANTAHGEGEGINLIDLCPLRCSALPLRYRVNLSMYCLL